ncbi:MAG: pyridoxine 5'-phosphate synthase [Acidobacteriota bacterium]
MIALSVNVNKVATLRNSRNGREPSVLQAVRTCIEAGAPGITVHPRSDERHIRRSDVLEIAASLDDLVPAEGARPEFNIEGDARSDFINLVLNAQPDQCTLVPVMPGEVTSQAGWSEATEPRDMRRIVSRLREAGIRVSLFVDPTPAAVRWAADRGADRVELFTEPYAVAFARDPVEGRQSFEMYAEAARLAHELGLGVNAGHDLDLVNLGLFRELPFLAEVSIGHALVSRALFVGLDAVVREYLAVLAGDRAANASGTV